MTAFVLKIIALTCMLIDHLGAVFPQDFPFYFRIIGRVAFPLFVYLIADGCRHTRSMPQYLLRLGAFALISEIPFDLAFNQIPYAGINIDFLKDTNIFYTLFLGALCVLVYQKLRSANRRFLPLLSIVFLTLTLFFAEWLGTDYGGFGVAFVFLMYVIPIKAPRLVVMALCCCYEFYPAVSFYLEMGYGFTYLVESGVLWMMAACLLSVPITALYNGKRGPNLKWFFYVFYPAHLLIYACVGLWRF